MIELWLISLTVSIAAFAVAIRRLLWDRNARNDALRAAHRICRDLKVRLNDVDLSDESEERYEVDMTLQSYFQEHEGEIRSLIKELRDARTGILARRDKEANALGDMLAWTVNEFYRSNYQEEEERIRIWTQNIDTFHLKMTRILDGTKESVVNS